MQSPDYGNPHSFAALLSDLTQPSTPLEVIEPRQFDELRTNSNLLGPVTDRTVIYINGKFAAQDTSGVQRVATRLVLALDEQVQSGQCVLLCPPTAAPPRMRNIEVRPLGGRQLPLTVWEQIVLPWTARQGLLLNLSGSAPAFSRRHVTFMHDAAVFDYPDAYTRTFTDWYRFLYRRLATTASSLITVSTFSRDRLAVSLGIPTSHFSVIPNGSDHLDARPDELVLDRFGLRDTPFLLVVGSSNRNKNVEALVAAHGMLKQPPRLVIVGGRYDRVFAKVRIAAQPNVVRTGRLDDTSLIALYRHALALVFPSFYEGFGMPPLEAMANGCPVIAARAASIPEVCGDAALYFDPYDITDIAAALQQVSHDVDLRHRLRKAGTDRAPQFSWASSASELRRILKTLGAFA